MRWALLLFILTLAGCTSSPGAAAPPAPTFDAHWHDGRAELDGYRFRISRYGQPREGEAVAIFVTEPFSRSRHVKLDDPARAPEDAIDVIKLNLVRDFQTGIYDYNTMVSVFSRTDDFEPVKVSMSSAEWCGHVYGEWIVEDEGIEERTLSYFEGESGTRTLPREDGVLEDNLHVLLRGLRGPYLAPGGRRSVAFLPGALVSRLAHAPAGWTTAEIERRAASERITVPAGTFEAAVYVVRTPVREGRFDIEAAWPHRVLRWSWTSTGRAAPSPGGTDESGELTGSARLEYWKLHGNGDERYRQQLGLSTRARD